MKYKELITVYTITIWYGHLVKVLPCIIAKRRIFKDHNLTAIKRRLGATEISIQVAYLPKSLLNLGVRQ